LQVFMGQRRRMFLIYVNFLLFMVIPATAVAALLYYVMGTTPIKAYSLHAHPLSF
jgi:hypothetical protein